MRKIAVFIYRVSLLMALLPPAFVVASEEKNTQVFDEAFATLSMSAIKARLDSCTSRKMVYGAEIETHEKCYYDLVADIRLTVVKCKSKVAINEQACKVFVESFDKI